MRDDGFRNKRYAFFVGVLYGFFGNSRTLDLGKESNQRTVGQSITHRVLGFLDFIGTWTRREIRSVCNGKKERFMKCAKGKRRLCTSFSCGRASIFGTSGQTGEKESLSRTFVVFVVLQEFVNGQMSGWG